MTDKKVPWYMKLERGDTEQPITVWLVSKFDEPIEVHTTLDGARKAIETYDARDGYRDPNRPLRRFCHSCAEVELIEDDIDE